MTFLRKIHFNGTERWEDKDGKITERLDSYTFFMGEKSFLSKTVFFHIY